MSQDSRTIPFETLDPAVASILEDAASKIEAAIKRFPQSGDATKISVQRVVWFYATLARSAGLGMFAMLVAECDWAPWVLFRSLYEYFTRATYFANSPLEAARFVRSMPVARQKSMTLRGHRLKKELRDEVNAAAEAALAEDPTLRDAEWELEKMMAAISDAKHKDRQLFYHVGYRFGSGVTHGDAWLLDKVYTLDESATRVTSVEPFRPLPTNRIAIHTANLLVQFISLIGEAHAQDVEDITKPLLDRLKPYIDALASSEESSEQATGD